MLRRLQVTAVVCFWHEADITTVAKQTSRPWRTMSALRGKADMGGGALRELKGWKGDDAVACAIKVRGTILIIIILLIVAAFLPGKCSIQGPRLLRGAQTAHP